MGFGWNDIYVFTLLYFLRPSSADEVLANEYLIGITRGNSIVTTVTHVCAPPWSTHVRDILQKHVLVMYKCVQNVSLLYNGTWWVCWLCKSRTSACADSKVQAC